MSEVIEVVGVLCVAAFFYLVWPPLALLVVGLALLVGGLALDGVSVSRKKNNP
jgi:predicted membrane metal-binding protein